MERQRDGLIQTAVFKEVRLQRILIHNGIALYTTWTTIASVSKKQVKFLKNHQMIDDLFVLVTCSF
jgi:hypothetical protein